jgi:hypothetical protein
MSTLTGIEATLDAVLKYPKQSDVTVTSKLLDLDQHGLTDAEFKLLIAKCKCGLIMTRRMFHLHQCLREPARLPAVQDRPEHITIDLTMDDGEGQY